MAYIYKIKNTENDLLYIGKTTYSLEARFKGHVKDSQNEYRKYRKLYRAMNKIGLDKFSIELIEEVEDNIASDREMYWIEKLDTYKNGYNATLGGEGKSTINHKRVLDEYEKLQCIYDVSWNLNIDQGTISKILKSNNVNILTQKEVMRRRNPKNLKPIKMMDVENNIISVFNGVYDAAKYIKDNNITESNECIVADCIKRVCNGKRSSSYGFKWEYV